MSKQTADDKQSPTAQAGANKPAATGMVLGYAQSGNDLYETHQYEAAIQMFDPEIASHPTAALLNSRALCYQALAERSPRYYQQAVADYEAALQLEPDNAIVLSNYAEACTEMGADGQAIRQYTAAIASDPNQHRAYADRALCYQRQGEFEQSAADFDRAIALLPDYAAYYNNRGISYGYLGRYEAALADFSRSFDLDPAHTTALYNSAWVYALMHDAANCLLYLRRVLERNPASRQSARSDKADYQWLIDHDPDFAAAFKRLVG